jgi:nitrite reductase/ring-hydroxylating ferredoxin subunit
MKNWDFWDWSLFGLGLFGFTVGLLVFLLYALPQEPLVIPEVQASVRVGPLEEMFPNTARLERWGPELILLIRDESGEVTALEGRSPSDGCVLTWDDRTGQVRSPCSYQIYNPQGFVIAGLSDQALRRYPVLIRDGVINIGSGA